MLVNTSNINIDKIGNTELMSDPAADQSVGKSTEGDEGLEPETVDMTVEQIAQDAGIPVSTVRMYQNNGLLPPPERRGRVGYYNADHRDRLRLIAHLQERGFSLKAIKEVFDSWNAGRSLDHLLGVNAVTPGLSRQPQRFPLAELAKRFDGVELSQQDIQRGAELGLIKIEGTEVEITNEAFADMGPAVAHLGVPVSRILDEYEALQVSVAGIAERFVAVFEEYLWEPLVADGLDAADIPKLTADVGQLTELASSVVTVELHERFSKFTEEYLKRGQDAFG